MSTEQTPGTWSVEDPMGKDEGDALWIVAEGASAEVYDWRCVALVGSDDADDMDCSSSEPILAAERDANARLIAAAPELLEASQKALNFITNTEGELGITLDSGDALRAAIAKALGQ